MYPKKGCVFHRGNITVTNNTPSDIKLTLTSSESTKVTVTANSEMSFRLKKGIYKWVAMDKNSNIISSGVININNSNGKLMIPMKK